MPEFSELRQQAQEALERAQEAIPGPYKADVDVYNPGDEVEAEILSTGDRPRLLFSTNTSVVIKESQDWERAIETQEYKNAVFLAAARQDVPLFATALLDLLPRLEKAERVAEAAIREREANQEWLEANTGLERVKAYAHGTQAYEEYKAALDAYQEEKERG